MSVNHHSNISIFVPHLGCPNACSFCNQKSITGTQNAPTTKYVQDICEKAMKEISYKENAEIAFFGGSFTAIDKDYMISLLDVATQFVGKNKFKGIRISTRPDCISEEILTVLKGYNVTSIELGVQSADDEVLLYNDRGHTFQDVVKAVELIRKYDFDLTLQMMVGLYKSCKAKDLETADKIIKLKPKNVRIYPVVILKNTKLEKLFKQGEYLPYTLDFAVELCCELIKKFDKNNIKIIKLGLHASEIVENDFVAGLYHPAFKELCENKEYYDKILSVLPENKKNSYLIYVPKNDLSKAIGQKKFNFEKLQNIGYKIKIIPDEKLSDKKIIVEEDEICI